MLQSTGFVLYTTVLPAAVRPGSSLELNQVSTLHADQGKAAKGLLGAAYI